jgi:hypothetical protein
MKAKLLIDVEIPDGATHYAGNLANDASFFKKKKIAQYDHWFVYNVIAGWHLYTHSKANCIKPIPFYTGEL